MCSSGRRVDCTWSRRWYSILLDRFTVDCVEPAVIDVFVCYRHSAVHHSWHEACRGAPEPDSAPCRIKRNEPILLTICPKVKLAETQLMHIVTSMGDDSSSENFRLYQRFLPSKTAGRDTKWLYVPFFLDDQRRKYSRETRKKNSSAESSSWSLKVPRSVRFLGVFCDAPKSKCGTSRIA